MALTFLISRRLGLTFSFSISFLLHISAAATASPPPSGEPEWKISLSARLSFVFDQIDALERQRFKDEALQRIRSWRLSKHQEKHSSAVADEESENEGQDGGMVEFFQREVELVHLLAKVDRSDGEARGEELFR